MKMSVHNFDTSNDVIDSDRIFGNNILDVRSSLHHAFWRDSEDNSLGFQ
jgi:hypothetical protein